MGATNGNKRDYHILVPKGQWEREGWGSGLGDLMGQIRGAARLMITALKSLIICHCMAIFSHSMVIITGNGMAVLFLIFLNWSLYVFSHDMVVLISHGMIILLLL